MTEITDQDFEVAREFIAHVRKYSALTGRNAVTAVRVLESLMPTQTPTLAEELREFAKWVENPIWRETKARVESMADRAEQIERECDEARAEVVRGRELIRKHKEKTDRAAGERDEARADLATVTRQRDEERQRNDDLTMGCEGRDAAEWKTAWEQARDDVTEWKRRTDRARAKIAERDTKIAELESIILRLKLELHDARAEV